MSHKWFVKNIQHDYFSKENLKLHPERFVLVGFIAADGCISVPKVGQTRLQFNLSQKDRCVLDFFNKEICDSTRNLSAVKKTNSFIFYVPSNQICEDLSRYGIVPRKTSSYDLPDLKGENMKYFLRGYFYGDGCCFKNGRMSMYHLVGTKNFINHLKAYLMANGILETCAAHPIKGRSNYLQLHIKGRHQASMFGEYIFSDNKMKLLPRKHKKLFTS